jgi:hypothetical protein
MKAILFSIFTILFSSAVFTQSGAIALPEMNIFYRGWNNKIVPVIPCNQELILELDGATADTATWTDADGNTFKGYHVNVSSSAKFVTIRVNGKLENGTIQNHGVFKYKVKLFPNGQLQGTSISLTTGFKAVVSLGPDSPFTGVSFNVTSGKIFIGNDAYSFSGDIIPASLIENVKPGKYVAIEVAYTKNGIAAIASGVLKVVP